MNPTTEADQAVSKAKQNVLHIEELKQKVQVSANDVSFCPGLQGYECGLQLETLGNEEDEEILINEILERHQKWKDTNVRLLEEECG